MSNRSTRPELPDTWLEAVRAADFIFYEVAEPSQRWAGGYGYSHDGPAMLEVLAILDGGEVSVETIASGEGPPPQLQRSLLLHDLVWNVLSPDQDDFELPHVLSLDEEDRTIDVDGLPTSFSGYSADGGAWLGAAAMADGRAVVVRDRSGVRPTKLARCTDWAMPDHGPALS